ncbi:branched-chain amino acid ABC transporter permease [Clostridium sp. chh4-2]|uniref:AzlC family ABC transporter permease n=1 Tax=Clostridium sp. chh4-2 TaxID=2067550 RepID=UPI000CCF9AEA|nr:AzlC family ABC transporter permease [Clostridium sp. chh4-2]PNV63379.1 branched-chain amino acid ABC transporter permease [Clostridium sp. chh4-2]
MVQTNSACYRRGLKDGIPIALGYIAVAFTLGIAAKNSGMTAFQATLMSLTNNTSAGEFAALGIIGAASPYIEMAISQAIINLRYLLMSCSLSQKLDPSFPLIHRFLIGYGVTDEIFGVSIGQPGNLNPFYTYGVISMAAPGWALGTCLGVVMGGVLPARIVRALSVALYGMFLAVVIPPAKKSRILAGVVAASMAASFLFANIPIFSFISSGMKIIILTVVIAGIAAILFPLKENHADEE